MGRPDAVPCQDEPESDEGAMDAVKSVWLANERVGTVEKVCVTNPQAPAVWQQMNTPGANAVDVPITNIAAADKACEIKKQRS